MPIGEVFNESQAIKAKEHVLWLLENFKSEMAESIGLSKIYREYSVFEDVKPRFVQTDIELWDSGTTQCAKRVSSPGSKIAILNFASYKEAGGGFMGGAMAQEEAICYESSLYPVLHKFTDEYYVRNRFDLNKGLYRDRAIYSPDILLFDDVRGNIFGKVDVITCAAPNVKSGLRYGRISHHEIDMALYSRIEFILNIAYENKVDTLVLGAFGCGVFGNDPTVVSMVFNNALEGKFKNAFKRVVFAVPIGRNSHNYVGFNMYFK